MRDAMPCAACGSSRTRVFYECEQIPVQSCVLLESAVAAEAYPRGDLSLQVCSDCGFIGNIAFSYDVQGEIDAYESSQAGSGRFSAYQRALCEQLAERHDLEGRHVLEIGSGAGDFLLELCEVAGCTGEGYDPTLPEARVERSFGARCRLLPEAFGEAQLGRPFDLLCCRHTLEHVAAPGEMVALSARASRRSGDAPVFFEVPDTLRILEDRAFWDVYYEHCAYFGTGSLTRLFRREGLRVTDLERVYDDQYLLITAIPAREGAPQPGPSGSEDDDLERMVQGAADFEREVGAILADWRARLARCAERGDRVALWGAGSKAAGFLATLGIGEQIPYIVDINPRKQGMFQAGTGQEIVAPDRLREYRPDLLVIMNAIYEQEIRKDLDDLGLSPEIVAL